MLIKKNQIYIFLFVLLFLCNLVFANLCLAEDTDDQAVAHPGLSDAPAYIDLSGTAGKLTQASFEGIIVAVVQALLTFVSVLFFILFLYGGFKWMTAAGSEEKIKDAKKIITNAVIGLGIVILSYTITYFISKSIETTPTAPTQGTPPVQIQGPSS